MKQKHLITAWVGAICLATLLNSISYSADVPAIRDAKDSAERARVQALIDGARKENSLDWTGTMVEPEHSKHVIAGFKEYYGLPQLKVSYTYARGAEVISRTNEVLKAGRTPPDVIWMVAWDWYVDLIKRGELLRYDSPYYKEYTFSNKAGNSVPGYWVSDSYTSNPMWNVKELEKRGIKNFNPASWWDFVDAKLIKYICLTNVAGGSSSGIPWAIGMRKAVGDEWFIKLAKGKPAFNTKGEQGDQWVATGEYPILLTARTKSAQDLYEKGVDIRLIWPKEGQVLFPFAPIIFAKASHPHTAKLFIDYVRSTQGANRMAETGVGLIYGRPGVKVPEKERRFLLPSEQITAIPMDWNKEATIAATNSLIEWAKKIGLGY